MIPLALSGVLCFSKVPFEGVALHAWVAFSYIFFGMSYTGTSMPFGAMANVVTLDPIERSKLSRARSIGGGLVGAVALGAVPVLCFDKDNNILLEYRHDYGFYCSSDSIYDCSIPTYSKTCGKMW